MRGDSQSNDAALRITGFALRAAALVMMVAAVAFYMVMASAASAAVRPGVLDEVPS